MMLLQGALMSNKLPMEWVSRIFIKFAIIFGQKWTKAFEKDDSGQIQSLFEEEWAIGLRGIEKEHIAQAIDYCRLSFEWPPSIAQFRKICQEQSGLPTPQEIMHLAIRKDFSNPITKLVYEKVGSWDFSHDKESTLLKKINKVYNLCINENKQASLPINTERKLKVVG